MICMIIAFFVAFLSFSFFMNSYQVNGINRLVYGMPLSLYETAINMLDIDEENGPYFDKEELENNISDYFIFHIYRYTDGLALNFYYYNISDHSADLSDECRAVEITICASLFMFNEYEKTMFYEIRSN